MNASKMSNLFREIVLVLGGVVAQHDVSDEAVAQMAAGLERVYRRAAAAHTPHGLAEPHPAFVKLLQTLGQARRVG